MVGVMVMHLWLLGSMTGLFFFSDSVMVLILNWAGSLPSRREAFVMVVRILAIWGAAYLMCSAVSPYTSAVFPFLEP